MKYKKGDKVRITANICGHSFKIGEIVEIVEADYSEDMPYRGEPAMGTEFEDYKGTWFGDYEADLVIQPTFPDITPPEDAPPTKRELHRQICEELNATYVKKNTDYGDSYGQLRARYPDSILIRVYDKFSRLERLLKGNKALVEDESVEDTLLDLANYCILEVIERRLNK